jgi:hypothetical protein
VLLSIHPHAFSATALIFALGKYFSYDIDRFCLQVHTVHRNIIFNCPHKLRDIDVSNINLQMLEIDLFKEPIDMLATWIRVPVYILIIVMKTVQQIDDE